MAEEEKSGEPTVQVMVVPEDAMESVAEHLKKLNLPDHIGTTGTGCRFTTHGDLHCGDTDPM